MTAQSISNHDASPAGSSSWPAGDLNTARSMFEAMCARDLRVYPQALGGTVCHYCDASDLEVDLVIRLRDGRWGAVEVKVGGRGYMTGRRIS